MDATEADMTLLKYLHTVGYRIGAIFRDDDRIVADQCTHLTFGTSGLVFIAISPVGHGLRRGGPRDWLAARLRSCFQSRLESPRVHTCRKRRHQQPTSPVPRRVRSPQLTAAASPSASIDEVKAYLWSVYQRSPTKVDGHGDFTWKDVSAARHSGLSVEDYVMGASIQIFASCCLPLDMRWTRLASAGRF